MPKNKSLYDSFCLNIVIFASNIRLDHETSKKMSWQQYEMILTITTKVIITSHHDFVYD